MNELEQNILDALRACDRKVLEPSGENEKLREELSSSYNDVIHIINDFNDDNKGGNKRNVRHQQQNIGTITIIKNIVRGGKVDIQAVRGFSKPKAYLVDGNQLNRKELLTIKKHLQKMYTEMTGIPASEDIKTDDELRNINSFEFLRNLADKIPEALRGHTAFKEVWEYCTPPNRYNKDRPYGNYYSNFLLALQEYVAKLQVQASADNNPKMMEYANDQLEALDKLIDAIYANSNFALERSYSIIRDAIQNVRQTDENELEKAVKKSLSAGGKEPEQRLGGSNVTTPVKSGSEVERLLANIGSEFKPMLTTGQPAEVRLSYKEPNDPKQLRFGTQGQIFDWKPHVNPLYQQWLAVQQRKLRGCNVIKMRKLPIKIDTENDTKSVDFDKIPIDVGFIRVGRGETAKLYYVNKLADKTKITKVNLTKENIQKFDETAFGEFIDSPVGEPKKLSPTQLKSIVDISTQLKIHDETQAKYLKKIHKTRITHIYFNNLSRVGGAGTFLLNPVRIAKEREKGMSQELEALEADYDNVAVITLPADGGMMDHHNASKWKKPENENYASVFAKILGIATGASEDIHKEDFNISKKVKKLLYGDGESYTEAAETKVLERLLKESFAELGFEKDAKLSEADQQAVFFHFIKFKLTNFIIDKLGPETFNFSCKDAIDRGGVSSAYYNLVKSIEKGKPISQEEFECILHGAPTLVKGRGMNIHTHLIWNAIDAYVNANIGKQHANGKSLLPKWLPEWRDKHAIPASPQYHLKELNKYIKQREGENDYRGIFSQGIPKSHKLQAAQGLLDELKEKNIQNARTKNTCVSVNVDESTINALQDKRLGRIVKGLEDYGYLELSQTSNQTLSDKPK